VTIAFGFGAFNVRPDFRVVPGCLFEFRDYVSHDAVYVCDGSGSRGFKVWTSIAPRYGEVAMWAAVARKRNRVRSNDAEVILNVNNYRARLNDETPAYFFGH
jgi:hypothetical protein